MATEADYEAAALTAASAITVSDIVSLVQWFVKLVGGHDTAQSLIEADRAAVREALDIAEDVRVAQEPTP